MKLAFPVIGENLYICVVGFLMYIKFQAYIAYQTTENFLSYCIHIPSSNLFLSRYDTSSSSNWVEKDDSDKKKLSAVCDLGH